MLVLSAVEHLLKSGLVHPMIRKLAFTASQLKLTVLSNKNKGRICQPVDYCFSGLALEKSKNACWFTLVQSRHVIISSKSNRYLH